MGRRRSFNFKEKTRWDTKKKRVKNKRIIRAKKR